MTIMNNIVDIAVYGFMELNRKKKIKKKMMCGKKQKNVTSRYKCHLPKKILIVLIELEWSTRRRIPERK